MGDLENQLLRVPSGTHDDLADALQGVVQLLGFPKKVKSLPSKEDMFMWWRNKAIEANQPRKGNKYIFGNKKKSDLLPATISYK